MTVRICRSHPEPSSTVHAHSLRRAIALDQLKGFLLRLQDDEALKQSVLAASTADDVAKIAARKGYSFSGDELLRFSGKKVGRVTVSKQETPGEYN